jgi:pimeloyl-ACP methyl ester carboxylesterase
VAVEKPFAGGDSTGTATKCGAQFNEDFTAERWMVALRAAMDDARKSPWVDPNRTLVLGFSEGAVMASLLSSHDKNVTDVIAMSGSGTTQLFDFVALAYRRCFDASQCLADIDRDVQAINAKPDSSTDFAWGHPYKRWTSFFRVDPGEELLRSNARVYIAFGTADDSVPALSEEHAVARLRLAKRDVTVRRVPNAGHSLSESQNGWDDLDREMRAALKWFRDASK